MKKKIYITLFFIICLMPSVGMLVLGPSEAAANETLSKAPAITDSEGHFNMEILSDIEDYIGDHFAFRQELITADHAVNGAVLRESGSDEVILGKDGWLFYSETLDDYEGTNIMTDRQLWCAARALSLMNEYCEGQDIDFLFTVAPNKNSVYPEYMPDRYPENTGKHNADLLYEELDKLDINYVDLKDVIASSDKILYRKGDSHWTEKGAALAADAINIALGRDCDKLSDLEFSTQFSEIGDLYEMLYPADEDHLDADMLPAEALEFEYEKEIRTVSDNRIDTCCSKGDGKLVMYRDSFGNALHKYMAESFESAVFSRISPYDFSLIEKDETNTVIIELVERNLDWLITKSAVMPAPLRDISFDSLKEAGLDLSEFSVSESDKFDGSLIIKGKVNADSLDFDSPVYIVCSGNIYEAFPQDDGGFTACITDPASTEMNFSLVVKCNGEYIYTDIVY